MAPGARPLVRTRCVVRAPRHVVADVGRPQARRRPWSLHAVGQREVHALHVVPDTRAVAPADACMAGGSAAARAREQAYGRARDRLLGGLALAATHESPPVL